MKIHNLFPTPVYETNIDRAFTKEELQLVKDSEIECIPNMGNTSSEDNYILEQAAFKNLKKELEVILKDYIDKIVSPNQKVECYITQSWLNYTKTNGYHHIHNHPNSYLSGVIYFDGDKEHDKIHFSKNDYNQIQINTDKYNRFNSSSWFVPVETGQVVIFPSHLHHMVSPKQGDNLRISLAFNSFIKGTLGIKNELTELRINV
jgi:uncharacterized protein (TIGR02466 family)